MLGGITTTDGFSVNGSVDKRVSERLLQSRQIPTRYSGEAPGKARSTLQRALPVNKEVDRLPQGRPILNYLFKPGLTPVGTQSPKESD